MANLMNQPEPQTRQPMLDRDPGRRMRDLMSWDPFREMVPMDAAVRLGFDAKFDVRELADAFMFVADMPGLQEKDIDVVVSGNRVTVSGKRTFEERDQHGNWYIWERGYGSFSRAFTLPDGCATDNAHAVLKDGVLTVRVPKRAGVSAKKLVIQKEAKAK